MLTQLGKSKWNNSVSTLVFTAMEVCRRVVKEESRGKGAGKQQEREIDRQIKWEPERERDSKQPELFTRADSACQNILPSPNWVIFDMRRMVPADWRRATGEPRAHEAPLAWYQSRHECHLQTIWHRLGTSRHKCQNTGPAPWLEPGGCNCYMGISECFSKTET